tara:strand:- start:4970 stop:5389 length:420 start_codon:yes stop_codon:yes gene_type:complete
LNSYNGFSPSHRYKALAWFKKEIKEGRKPAKPDICDACGQKDGVLAWHSEDYSEPFGSHIGEHGLCYLCHMMIHCRFKNKATWSKYVDIIESGMVAEPFHFNDFKTFANDFLNKKMVSVEFKATGFNGSKLLSKIGGIV